MTDRSLSASTALATGEAYKSEIGRWASLIKSGAMPKHVRSPEMAIALARYGEQFGWDAMRSLNAVYIVDGKPSMSAEAMVGLVREKLPEASIEPQTMTAEMCEIRARRSPSDPWAAFSFSIEEAKTAGLARKQVWIAYPADMLWARCVSRVCRRLFSDVTHGAYTTVEAQDVEWTERGKLRTADVIPPELLPAQEQAAITDGDAP